jgi:hypothetical protein
MFPNDILNSRNIASKTQLDAQAAASSAALAAVSFGKSYQQCEHFFAPLGTGGINRTGPFSLNVSGLGSASGFSVSAARNGVVRCALGAIVSADQFCFVRPHSSDSCISMGSALVKNVWVAAVSTNLSATETGFFRIGFMDSFTNAEPVDGVYFRSQNGENWFCVCRKNSVETAIDSGIPVSINFHVFDIEVSADGSNATFKINSAVAGTVNTNIPTGSGRETSFGAGVTRSSNSNYAAALDIDFLYLRIDWNNAIF